MAGLVGTEILQVVPLRWDNTPSPVSEQTTTAAIAALASAPGIFGTAFLAWFATLPTTLPSTPGKPWNNGNTLAIS